MVAIHAHLILSELLKHVDSEHDFKEDRSAPAPNDKKI